MIARGPAPPALTPARWAGIFLELGKWRLSALVTASAIAGFLMAAPTPIPIMRLFWAALGTFLLAAGANGLNQWAEADRDGLMLRTRGRPLPSGRIGGPAALSLAVTAVLVGCLVLGLGGSLLAAALGLFNVLLYALAYTPLKVVTPLNTLVGAVCGAIPPMMGWAAAAGRLDPGAFALAAVLFVWQIPHSLSLGYLHREDYARGGFRMLPVVDNGGWLTFHVINLYCLALVPVSLGSVLLGLAGWSFALGAVVLGGALAGLGVVLWRRRGAADARRLFLGTIGHLPLLLALLVIDHRLIT